MNCLRNNQVYILSPRTYIFHDSNEHPDKMLLVDFTNPVKLDDLELLHHITIPENGIMHRCGYSCTINEHQVFRGYNDYVTNPLGMLTVGYKCFGFKAKQILAL